MEKVNSHRDKIGWHRESRSERIVKPEFSTTMIGSSILRGLSMEALRLCKFGIRSFPGEGKAAFADEPRIPDLYCIV